MEFRNAETLLLKLNISRFCNGLEISCFSFFFILIYLSRDTTNMKCLHLLLHLYFINYDAFSFFLFFSLQETNSNNDSLNRTR